MKKNRFRNWMAKLWRLLKWLALIFLGTSVFFTLLYRFFPVPVTPLIPIRFAEQIAGDRDIVYRRNWISIDEMSPYLIQAVVASEDQRFLEHWGFDFESMRKAFEHNKKGKKVRGGSTISQQTAKNVFLWPARSYVRKGLEAYFTFLIEVCWSKERIMEVYLNVIEYGNGIYGCEAASEYYFKKPCSKLTRNEAALLAAILPSPLKSNPARPSNYVLRRQQHVLKQMGFFPQIKFDNDDEDEKKPAKKKKKRKNTE
jgi:monofunctional biosynthetic peptidoglycan transglycosylase